MKNHSFSVKQDIEFGVGIVEKFRGIYSETAWDPGASGI